MSTFLPPERQSKAGRKAMAEHLGLPADFFEKEHKPGEEPAKEAKP